MRYVDGLTNPRSYHRPPAKRRFQLLRYWRSFLVLIVIGTLLSYFAGPKLSSLAQQVEIWQTLTNGRYLVLFQNDTEIRASGGFIGSFAVIEAKNKTIKPLYFEKNIYQLDDPYNQTTHLPPPQPIVAAIGERGWGLRDANFAADFRQSAPTVEWFFDQETKKLTGPKKAELDAALDNNYQLDGVVAVNLSAFIDILDAIGPLTLANNTVVNAANFADTIQSIVERDYFTDPTNKQINEPKTVLQEVFTLALQKSESLPRTIQYSLAKKLLKQKKVLVYTNSTATEKTLVDQGWAGALQLPSNQLPKTTTDFLAVVRSSHGGNKSSGDINPIYRYKIDTKDSQTAKVELEISFEHTGNGQWPSGVNHEYLRVLTPPQTNLTAASQNGEDVLSKIDIGQEMGQTAFGFWLHTEPKSSQTITLNYELPRRTVLDRRYQLTLIRQPGGNSPDINVIYNDKVLYQGRLSEDRLIF